VQHHRDAGLGAETLRIPPEGEQGLRRAREEWSCPGFVDTSRSSKMG